MANIVGIVFADGVNAIIKGGPIQKGDTLVLSANFEQKKEKHEAGVSLFGPPRGGNNRQGGNRPQGGGEPPRP